MNVGEKARNIEEFIIISHYCLSGRKKILNDPTRLSEHLIENYNVEFKPFPHEGILKRQWGRGNYIFRSIPNKTKLKSPWIGNCDAPGGSPPPPPLKPSPECIPVKLCIQINL